MMGFSAKFYSNAMIQFISKCTCAKYQKEVRKYYTGKIKKIQEEAPLQRAFLILMVEREVENEIFCQF
jgi:hypothetical protein